MKTMRTIILVSLALGMLACAVGKDPPEQTTQVEFVKQEALTFAFGDDTPCGFDCTASSVSYVYPKMQVRLNPFAIDIHEVTNAQYEYCVAMGVCSDPEGYNLADAGVSSYFRNGQFNNHPVVNVTWQQATTYCQAVGMRLPTELEWEYVYRSAGTDARPYAFGAKVEDCVDQKIAVTYCDVSVSRPEEVMGSDDDVLDMPDAALGANPVETQVYDMMGNVAEWVDNSEQTTLTCKADDAFNEQCGDGCKALCAEGDDGCVAACLACDYCLVDHTDTCFQMCGKAMCLKRDGVFQQPKGHEEISKALIAGEDRMYRGGHFLVSENKTGARGLCMLRASYRKGKLDSKTSGDWVGFRCARDLE